MADHVEPLSGREAGAVEEATWSILGGLLARHATLGLSLREAHGSSGADVIELARADGTTLLALDRRRRQLSVPGAPGRAFDYVARLASARRLNTVVEEAAGLAGLASAEPSSDPKAHTLSALALLTARTRGPLAWLELRLVACRAHEPCVPAAALAEALAKLGRPAPDRPGSWLAVRVVGPWGPDPRGPIGFVARDGRVVSRLGKPAEADLWAGGVADPKDAVGVAARTFGVEPP